MITNNAIWRAQARARLAERRRLYAILLVAGVINAAGAALVWYHEPARPASWVIAGMVTFLWCGLVAYYFLLRRIKRQIDEHEKLYP